MKSFNKQEKDLLDGIVNNKDGKHRFGGELMKPMLANASIACMLVNGENDGWIFSLSDTDDSQSKSLAKIVWLFSFLEYCECENLIYCVEDNDYNAIMFGTSSKVRLSVETEGKKYKNNNDDTIEVCEGMATWKEKNGKLKMEGFQCPQNLTCTMKRYFASTIFPTSVLMELQANDYKTQEELSLSKQLKDAKHNLRIAQISLIVSLSMPIISIFVSNRLGYATIEKTQYEEITRLLDSLIVIECPDIHFLQDSINEEIKQ